MPFSEVGFMLSSPSPYHTPRFYIWSLLWIPLLSYPTGWCGQQIPHSLNYYVTLEYCCIREDIPDEVTACFQSWSWRGQRSFEDALSRSYILKYYPTLVLVKAYLPWDNVHTPLFWSDLVESQFRTLQKLLPKKISRQNKSKTATEGEMRVTRLSKVLNYWNNPVSKFWTCFFSQVLVRYRFCTFVYLLSNVHW